MVLIIIMGIFGIMLLVLLLLSLLYVKLQFKIFIDNKKSNIINMLSLINVYVSLYT